MQRTRMFLVFLALAAAGVAWRPAWGAWVRARDPYASDPKFEVGNSKYVKDLRFDKNLDFNQARKSLKPYILYVYDPKRKPNHTAETLEKDLFARRLDTDLITDLEVKEALLGFLRVLTPSDSPGWPRPVLDFARANGAALLVFTSDDHYVAVTTKGPFLAAVRDAAARNRTLVERLKANPAPDWVPPGAERPATGKAAPPPAPAAE